MNLFKKNLYNAVSKQQKNTLDDDIQEIDSKIKENKKNSIIKNTTKEIPVPLPPKKKEEKSKEKEENIVVAKEHAVQKYQTYSEIMLTHQQISLKKISFWIKIITMYGIILSFVFLVLYTLKIFQIV